MQGETELLKVETAVIATIHRGAPTYNKMLRNSPLCCPMVARNGSLSAL